MPQAPSQRQSLRSFRQSESVEHFRGHVRFFPFFPSLTISVFRGGHSSGLAKPRAPVDLRSRIS